MPIQIMETILITSVMFTCTEGQQLAQGAMLAPLSNQQVNEVIAEYQKVVPENCLLPTLRISKN